MVLRNRGPILLSTDIPLAPDVGQERAPGMWPREALVQLVTMAVLAQHVQRRRLPQIRLAVVLVVVLDLNFSVVA
jgi:hypothetical protein